MILIVQLIIQMTYFAINDFVVVKGESVGFFGFLFTEQLK